MIIKHLRLHPIAVADAPIRSSYGLHAPYALRTIVELESTDGIIGISETYGGDRPLAALEAARPWIEGQDPFQFARLWRQITQQRVEGDSGDSSQTYLVPGENPLDQHTRTYAALEVACLDMIGKALNMPVCDIVGGRARDAAPFSAYLFYKHGGGGGRGDDAREDKYGECLDGESIVRQAFAFIKEYGFKEIKLKAGVLDPEAEMDTIRRLRAAFGPHVPLRIDPNCAWSVETSVRVGEGLKQELSDGGYLEDPCATLEGMAEVRRQLLHKGIRMEFASNVAVTTYPDVVRARDLEAVQIVLSDPHYWGGIRNQQRLAQLCETLGRGVSMHSNNHVGVSMMIMAHAAAAMPHLTHACDTHYPWQTEKDEVVEGGRIRFVDGTVPIPKKAGLGVTLDRDQLGRLTERYHKLPYRRRDDEAEMREHVDPNWRRILPRW